MSRAAADRATSAVGGAMTGSTVLCGPNPSSSSVVEGAGASGSPSRGSHWQVQGCPSASASAGDPQHAASVTQSGQCPASAPGLAGAMQQGVQAPHPPVSHAAQRPAATTCATSSPSKASDPGSLERKAIGRLIQSAIMVALELYAHRDARVDDENRCVPHPVPVRETSRGFGGCRHQGVACRQAAGDAATAAYNRG